MKEEINKKHKYEDDHPIIKAVEIIVKFGKENKWW